MALIIFNANDDDDFNKDMEQDIRMKEWLLTHNPLIYGIQATVGSQGELSKGIKQYSHIYFEKVKEQKMKQRVAPDMIPHPLYVDL